MPHPNTARLPPPTDADEFEKICVDALRIRWACRPQPNGRRGQGQLGVDIFLMRGSDSLGAQCKNTHYLSPHVIDKEVTKAQAFQPPLTEFLILTSAPRDAKVQERVRLQVAAGVYPFPVCVLFWEDILAHLAEEPETVVRLWPAWRLSEDDAPRVPAPTARGPRRSEHGFVFDAASLPPSRETRRVVAGEPPKLADVADGCFMQRAVQGAARAALDVWWSATRSGKVPVFWIAGRSGDGKSVLLLQLVRYFLEDGPSRNALFAHSAESVLQALEANKLAGVDLLVFDDLHTVCEDTQVQRIEDACRVLTPSIAVLTAGPSEQASAFERRLGAYVAIRRFSLPPVGAGEYEALVTWFANRLGREPTPVGALGNRLAVQIAFEQVMGLGIRDFSGRFQQRLLKLGIFNVARRIVVATACDAGLPLACVPPADRDALDRLCQEDQLHFSVGNEPHQPVRLGHPRLAGLLLEAWLDDIARPARAWAAALLEAAEAELTATGRQQIFAGFARTAELSAGAPPWADVAAEFQRLEQESYGGARRERIAIWAGLVRSGRFPGMREALVGRMAELLDYRWATPSTVALGWILAAPLGEDAIAPFRSWFLARESDPSLGDALSAVFDEVEEPELEDFIDRWVTAHHTEASAARLLSPMLGRRPQRAERTREELIAWIAAHPSSTLTPWVLPALLAKSRGLPNVRAIALEWLDNHPGPRAVDNILTAIVNAFPDETSVEAILRWHRAGLEVPHALSTAIANVPRHRALVEACGDWVRTRAHDPRTPNLLCAILKTRMGDVRKLTTEWLSASRDAGATTLVLTALAAAYPEDGTLTPLLLDWVTRRRFGAEIGNLLGHLLGRKLFTEAARNEALAWLEGATREVAGRIVQPLLGVHGRDPEVRAAVARWYDAGTVNLEAARAWMSVNPEDDRAKRTRDATLVDPRAHHELVTAVITAYSGCEVDRGVRAWIASNADTRPQVHVLGHYIRWRGHEVSVREYAHAWLDRNPNHGMAKTVLIELMGATHGRWGREPDIGTLERAASWIVAHPEERAVGYLIPGVLSLLDSARAPAVLPDIARAWLTTFPAHKMSEAVLAALLDRLSPHQTEALASELLDLDVPASAVALLAARTPATPNRWQRLLSEASKRTGRDRGRILAAMLELAARDPGTVRDVVLSDRPWDQRKRVLSAFACAVHSGSVARSSLGQLPRGETLYLEQEFERLGREGA